MRIMETSFRRSHACTAALSVPNPAVGHHQPTPHQRLLDAHGQVWVSLLWGHCSFLRGPGAHKILFVPSKSLIPQSCVSSGGSMVGLMVTSSKRNYAIPRSTEPKAPAPAAVHCWSIPPQETLKHSSVSVFVGSLGSGAHKVFWALWESLVDLGFDSKQNFTPPTMLLWLLLCPWTWEFSLKLLQHHITLNMPANLENSAVATGLEKVSFHSSPKEQQCKRMLKQPYNCTHLTC